MNSVNAERIHLVVREHHEQLVAFLIRKTNSPEIANELAQDTYEKLMRLDNFQNISNLKAYVFQIASNLAIDLARRRSLHRNYVSTQHRRGSEPAGDTLSEPSAEELVLVRERLERLQSAIDLLPQKCRRVFLMHRLENRTYPEIAKLMSISVSMVEKYIIQALKECHKCDETAD